LGSWFSASKELLASFGRNDDPEPFAGSSDGVDWNGTGVRAQAIVNDRYDSGLSGTRRSADDVDLPSSNRTKRGA